MLYQTKIIDLQVGRNAEFFACAIARLPSPDRRYGYLRILISIIEQAHPEWNQASSKPQQITFLVSRMSNGALEEEEVAEVVRVRDDERGY